MTPLTVRSNVSRDLLQASQNFKTDSKAIWEYVANSLQYVDPGVVPEVMVSIDERGKAIRVADNGAGMDRTDLEHFFTMHGENRERASGRPGRGLWGTGKSAAFGIASRLTMTSVRGGKRNIVQLTRQAIQATEGTSDVPVEILEEDRPTGEPNGTVVEVADIHLRKIDRGRVISHIERYLSRHPNARVFVDSYPCQFKEPEVAEEYRFTPEREEVAVLGNVQLVVKVSKSPLGQELQGIHVYSHRNLHTATLAGAEGKPMAEHLFGEVEVPALEDYKGPIAPFDSTRSGELNPENEIVVALHRFIGPAVDKVRAKLVARRRERARTEEAKRLAEQAEHIAEILSQDFAEYQTRLRHAHSATAGRDLGRRYAPLAGEEEEGSWSEGGDQLAERIRVEEPGTATADGRDDESRLTPPDEFPQPVEPSAEGQTTGGPRGGRGTRRSPRGGFRVEHRNMGATEGRGRYQSQARTILINLDHPEIAAAASVAGIEDQAFLRLTYEVAVTEYATALAQELIEVDQITYPDEALFEIRETIDRVSRHLAYLYQSW